MNMDLASHYIKLYLSILFKGQDECALRLPFPLQGYTLLWNDYLRNCRCNEYLAGIKHYEAGWDGKAASATGTKTKL